MYLVNRIEETTVKYHDARQVIGRFIMKEQDNLHHYTIPTCVHDSPAGHGSS